MNRRGFLKALLAVPAAVAAVPLIRSMPPVHESEPEVVVESISGYEMQQLMAQQGLISHDEAIRAYLSDEYGRAMAEGLDARINDRLSRLEQSGRVLHFKGLGYPLLKELP